MKGASAICFALCVLKIVSAASLMEGEDNIELSIRQSQNDIDNMKKVDSILEKDLTKTEESFRTSVIGLLTTSAQRIGGHSQELAQAFGQLNLGLLNHTVDLSRSVAYVPYLLAVDGPVHMMKMFVMLRDIGQIPLGLRGAVDVVERYVSETQHQDIMNRLVVPLAATPVNFVDTVQKFFSSIIGSMARFWGGQQV